MTAEKLMKRFQLSDHIENGSFVERHYSHSENTRADSGSIYYYVSPDEITKFHVIDCDEYWCYVKETPLQIWKIDIDGNISTEMLGIEEGCEPLIFLRRGTIFGSRHIKKEEEGTFLSCITVPRFQDAGFTLLEKEEILKKYPELEEFYAEP